jgi:hypothetical protein
MANSAAPNHLRMARNASFEGLGKRGRVGPLMKVLRSKRGPNLSAIAQALAGTGDVVVTGCNHFCALAQARQQFVTGGSVRGVGGKPQ